MAQIIIELSSYEKLFDLKMHRELCQLQHFLSPSFKPFAMLSPYRQIFHISNFAGCLSPLNRDNCTTLSTYDLKNFKIQLEKCYKSRKAIIQCGRDCIGAKEADGEERHNCQQCERIPSNCTSQMWFDLFYRILPKDLLSRKANNEKIYVNTFLPLYTYSAYGFQGFNVSIDLFISLEKDLKEWSSQTKELKVKGYLLDIKRDILLSSALSDSKLAIFAAAIVFLLVFIYSLSLGYTIAVFIELGASVLMAAAVYRGFSVGFPLLNLVSFVLLLSIGSDGAFLLFNAFPTKADDLDEDNFDECLSHTITTMFLAQFSTIVPFLLNLVSSVIVFRQIIEIAFLVFHRRFIEPFFEEKCFPSITKFFKILCFPFTAIRKCLRYLAFDTLPFVLIDGRFIWIGALSVLIILGGYSSLMQLRLPQYNPLQLFTANNPHEWYDNHAEKLFEFVAKKIALPLTVRLLWGFEKTPALSHFDSTKIANVSQDRRFELKTVEDVKRLADDMQRFRMLEFVGIKEKYWPERYVSARKSKFRIQK
uniref:SSD domain-containing protein n=1 Tax=Panagrolaimus davidi TaxID=227884 RepID=A0A914QJH6_9BILA